MSQTSVVTNTSTLSDHIIGQVKWFNTKAGYGFITVRSGEHTDKDIFVHYSSILVENSQYKYLVQGEYVEFSLVKSNNDKYEYHAVNVSGINRGPIMCETRKASETNHSSTGRPHSHRIRKYNTGSHSTDDRPPSRKSETPSSTGDGFKEIGRPRRVGSIRTRQMTSQK